MITADTSFLFSLYGKDGFTEKARTLSKSVNSSIILTVFNILELTNSALQAEFSGHLEAGLGHKIISRFDSEIEIGRLKIVSIDPTTVIKRAISLSRSYSLSHGYRTYDVLLVAAALALANPPERGKHGFPTSAGFLRDGRDLNRWRG